MPLKIVRDNIVNIQADAIVNSANPEPVIGGGTDSAIYEAAGEEKLLKARQKIGSIERGHSVATPGYDLCKIVIHTVGPRFEDGSSNEKDTLRSCYRSALNVCEQQQCHSIAFPLISTGVYAIPRAEGISIAISEITDYLLKSHYPLDVILCVFDEDCYALAMKAFPVESYIDTPSSKEELEKEYYGYASDVSSRAKKSETARFQQDELQIPALVDFHDNSSFGDTVRYYCQNREKKTREVYDYLGLSKQSFSKILNGIYKPNKEVLLKMCLFLELTLPQIVDLFARCGMALNPSEPFDSIVYQCLKNGILDLYKIGSILDKNGVDHDLY